MENYKTNEGITWQDNSKKPMYWSACKWLTVSNVSSLSNQFIAFILKTNILPSIYYSLKFLSFKLQKEDYHPIKQTLFCFGICLTIYINYIYYIYVHLLDWDGLKKFLFYFLLNNNGTGSHTWLSTLLSLTLDWETKYILVTLYVIFINCL